MAALLLSVMGPFAEFERSLIRERQREGIALARQRGAYRGRARALNGEQVAQLRQRVADGTPKATLAREFGSAAKPSTSTSVPAPGPSRPADYRGAAPDQGGSTGPARDAPVQRHDQRRGRNRVGPLELVGLRPVRPTGSPQSRLNRVLTAARRAPLG